MLTVSAGADMVLRKGMRRFWITGLTAAFSQEYKEKICFATISSSFLVKYQTSQAYVFLVPIRSILSNFLVTGS